MNALKVEPSFVNGTGEEASQGITRSREGHGEERSEVETLQKKLSAAQEMYQEVGVVINSLNRCGNYIIKDGFGKV